MIYKFSSLVVVTSAFLVIGANGLGEIDTEHGSNWLNGSDFQLETTVRIMGVSESKPELENKVTEYYSNEQKRAVIEINHSYNIGKVLGSRYTFAEDKLIKQSHVDGNYDGYFDVKPEEDLYQILFGNFGAQMGEIIKQINGNRGTLPNYLIGPARLAFWVNSWHSDLVPTNVDDRKIRHLNTNCYTFRHPLNLMHDKTFKSVLACYPKKYPGSPLDRSNSIPQSISILLPSNEELIFDYSAIRLLDKLGPIAEYDKPFDRFMVPINENCNLFFKDIDLLRGGNEPPVASFRANLESLPLAGVHEPFESSQFVAYDGYAGVLRRDSIRVSNEGDSIYSVTITDFGRRRKYNIKQKLNMEATEENGLLQLQDGDENQCVATKIYGQRSQIIPTSLVEMGQTTVRGIKSVAYETATKLLPDIFFPPITYLDTDNSDATRNDPLGINHDKSSTYTMVYYFAMAVGDHGASKLRRANGDFLGPLLRIKVYIKGELVHTLDIEDFVWNLVDAPNGDRANELFSVHDKCSNQQARSESFVDLRMELELEEQPGNSTNPVQPSKVLESGLKRNQAIFRALSQKTNLAPTQIHDLESRISKQSKGKLLIKVDAKLEKPSKSEIFEATNIGLTTLRGANNNYYMDFDSCFWEAIHRERPKEIVFAFCYPYCAIYDKRFVKMGPKNEITIKNQPQPSLGIKPSCPVFNITSKYDYQDVGTRHNWKYLTTNLQQINLILSILDKDAWFEMKFSPKKVEIGGDRWSVSGTKLHSDEQIFEGIGLVAGSAHILEIDSSGMANESSDSMSYALCHSKCAGSFDCKSFSLCLTSGKLECLLSKAKFRDTEILEQIEHESANLRLNSITKSGTITIQSKSSKNDGEVKQPGAIIELRVDRRCHLYNKRTLELFGSVEIARVVPEKQQFVAADSEEECAEICIERNMRHFERAAQIRAHFAGEYAAKVEMRAKDEKENLFSWCDSVAYIETERLEPYHKKNLDLKALTKTGLCHIKGKFVYDERATIGNQRVATMAMNKYDFIYSSLYAPTKAGVRLLATDFVGGVNLDDLAPAEAEILLSMHNNQKMLAMPNPEACARLCFMQLVDGLKPSCKSFGFGQKHTESGLPQQYCVFNSNTMSTMLKSLNDTPEAAISQTPSNETFQHYEPKHLFGSDGTVLTSMANQKGLSPLGRLDQTSGLHSFGIFVLSVVALIGGATLGAAMSAYLSRRLSESNNQVDDVNITFAHERFESEDVEEPNLST